MSEVYSPPVAEHVVMVGTDWWGCICGTGGRLLDGGIGHAGVHGVEMAVLSWQWTDLEVADAGPTYAELHEFLWGVDAL